MRGNRSEGSGLGLRRRSQVLSKAVRSVWPRRWWTEWMTAPGRSAPQTAGGPMTEELEQRRLLSAVQNDDGFAQRLAAHKLTGHDLAVQNLADITWQGHKTYAKAGE